MLDHKTNLDQFKRIEITQNMFADNSGIKLEINNRKKFATHVNMWKLHNPALNNQELNKKAKWKLENTLR